MRKINLLFLMLLLPLFLFSQVTINPDYKIVGTITPEMLNTTSLIGAWKVRGGLDMNKNGKMEIVILTDVAEDNSGDEFNQLYWLEENEEGNYDLLWSYTNFPIANSWNNFTVADVDQDGNQEIWVVLPSSIDYEPNPARLFCFEYDPVTGMPSEPTLTWNLGLEDNFDYRATSVTIADLDGDGEMEIIITSRQDDFWDYNYSGTWSTGRTVTIANYFLPIEPGCPDFAFSVLLRDSGPHLKGGYVFEAKVVDFDGDGVNELWVFTWDYYTVNIYLPTASGQYEHLMELRAIAEDYGDDIGSRDGNFFCTLNGDGKMVGFMAGSTGDEGSSSLWVIESIDDIHNLTANNFKRLVYGEGGSNYRGGCIADFNGNGTPEFVVVDNTNSRIMSLEYNKVGSISDPANYSFTEIADFSGFEYKNLQFAYSGYRSDGTLCLILPNLSVGELDQPSVYVLQYTQAISVEKKAELPEGYNLSQNYPNPFNPSTNIEFSIPKATHVSLKIYNVLGQEMLTLVNETKEAGSYIATFNAKSLPSGTYWYTIKTDNYTETKKMMLIK